MERDELIGVLTILEVDIDDNLLANIVRYHPVLLKHYFGSELDTEERFDKEFNVVIEENLYGSTYSRTIGKFIPFTYICRYNPEYIQMFLDHKYMKPHVFNKIAMINITDGKEYLSCLMIVAKYNIEYMDMILNHHLMSKNLFDIILGNGEVSPSTLTILKTHNVMNIIANRKLYSDVYIDMLLNSKYFSCKSIYSKRSSTNPYFSTCLHDCIKNEYYFFLKKIINSPHLTEEIFNKTIFIEDFVSNCENIITLSMNINNDYLKMILSHKLLSKKLFEQKYDHIYYSDLSILDLVILKKRKYFHKNYRLLLEHKYVTSEMINNSYSIFNSDIQDPSFEYRSLFIITLEYHLYNKELLKHNNNFNEIYMLYKHYKFPKNRTFNKILLFVNDDILTIEEKEIKHVLRKSVDIINKFMFEKYHIPGGIFYNKKLKEMENL